MIEHVVYEVLKVRYDDEENPHFEETGIGFVAKGDAVDFVKSDRYRRMLHEAAISRSYKEYLDGAVRRKVSHVFDSMEEYDLWADMVDRQKALEKLSPRELQLLGL